MARGQGIWAAREEGLTVQMDKVRAKANESVRWDILRSFFFFLLADGIMGCRDGDQVGSSRILDTLHIFFFQQALQRNRLYGEHIEEAIWVSSVACRVGASAPRAMGQELVFFF